MKTVVLLCGSNEVGKTRTLKRFFNVSFETRLPRNKLLERTLDGKRIYAVSLSSPQELTEVFCDVKEVISRIEERIKKCEEESHGQDYILIIPFGIIAGTGRNEGQLNERCLIEPIERLKSLGYRVFSIYLRKERARLCRQIDLLMKKITSHIINSDENYDRQAKELESLIKSL